MAKVRVYELSKQLNTTSKRLMEKLKEINIEVKNHMSLLSDNELNALYDHIGVIRHEDSDVSEKKINKDNIKKADPSKDVKKEIKKDIKSAPRIIRKTEIIIEGDKDEKKKEVSVKPSQRKPIRDVRKKSVVKRTDENSGLRMGFVRDTGNNYANKISSNVSETVENKEKKVSPNRTDVSKDRSNSNYRNSNETKSTGKNETDKKVNEQDKKTNFRKDNERSRPEQGNRPVNRTGTRPANQVQNNQGQQSQNARPVRQPYNRDNNQTQGNNQGQGTSQGQGNKYNNQGQGTRYSNQGQQGTRYSNQGQGTRYSNQGQGNKPPYNKDNKPDNRQGNRPPYNKDNRQRTNNRPGPNKQLEIPKADMSIVKKEETNHIKAEQRREFQNKEVNKDIKKDGKKDTFKNNIYSKTSKYKGNQTAIVGEKKGVSEVLSEEFVLNEFYSSDDGVGKKSKRRPSRNRRYNTEVKIEEPIVPKIVKIVVSETITVKLLAEKLKKTSSEVIKKLMGLGVMATLNQDLDFDTATIIATEYGIETVKEVVVNEEDILFDDSDDDVKDLEERPPVVVVMGHVDHGKTSLLDAIRETNIIEKEAGGITQHIGAYRVSINNRQITFLDTPGHEAFTAMRARGAQVTDIAILVVAADDGIMPQTIEAINHAKAANVTVIVAINKIDKEGANPDKVKQDLTGYGLVAEEWGGDIICVPVSAKQRLNIDQLLEMVLLSADVLELKSNKNKQAKGTVVEAKLDKNRGPVATILVQRGTLEVGNTLVTGTIVGRIRAMTDDRGEKVNKAGPSTPVEILGLPEVPEAGELFYAVSDERVAKQLVVKRKQKSREANLHSSSRVSLDDLFNQIQEGKVKDLNLIVKADVQGSVEAVKQSLEKLTNDEVRIKISHGGVGTITEADITLAEVSNAIIIGFNVRPSNNILELAENAGVDIRLYRIIYKAIEDIESAMKGMLDPTYKEVVQGHTEIRQLFKVSGIGTIGGCYVTDGKILRNSDVRIVRDGIIIHEGKLSSLKRFKDDAKEVNHGYECGLQIDKFNDIRVGDIVESFMMEEVEK